MRRAAPETREAETQTRHRPEAASGIVNVSFAYAKPSMCWEPEAPGAVTSRATSVKSCVAEIRAGPGLAIKAAKHDARPPETVVSTRRPDVNKGDTRDAPAQENARAQISAGRSNMRVI